jgi:hypothetical protein
MSNSTKLLNYGTIGYFTHSVNRNHQIGNRKHHPVICHNFDNPIRGFNLVQQSYILAECSILIGEW